MGALILSALLVCAGTLDTNTAFQEGVSLYEELEFEQAIFRFEAAALSPELTDPEKAMVFGWMAMSYAGIGNIEGAKRSLKNALLKDPDVTLPPLAPPKVKQWLAEVRAETAPAAAATHEPSPAPASDDAPEATAADPAPTATTEPPPAAQTAPPSAAQPDEAEQPTARDGGAARFRRKRPPTEAVEEFTLTPEEPEESSGAMLGGILMMGGGAGAVVIAALAAVPATIFILDGLYVIQPILDDIGRAHPEYDTYAQAQTTDYIVGGSLAAVGIVFAAVGAGMIVIGGGAATYGLLE